VDRVTREEVQDAVRKAFANPALAADRERSWAQIAELGFLMLAVPEELGGLGLGGEAAGVIHTELGHALVPGAAIAQMLTIAALAEAGNGDLLERAMGGETMTASLVGGRDGETLAAVPDADRASHALVRTPERIALVPLADTVLVARPAWDETRRLFDVVVPDGGLVLAEGGAAARLTEKLDGQLSLALAGDALGAARAALVMTVDYLKTRRQFDRPLAMFQALKHRCADLKTRLAAAEALFWSRAGEAASDARALGALKAHVTTVACAVAEEAIQLHGGIGLTVEHPCHLYFKRTMLDAALGGDADFHQEAAGRALIANAG